MHKPPALSQPLGSRWVAKKGLLFFGKLGVSFVNGLSRRRMWWALGLQVPKLSLKSQSCPSSQCRFSLPEMSQRLHQNHPGWVEVACVWKDCWYACGFVISAMGTARPRQLHFCIFISVTGSSRSVCLSIRSCMLRSQGCRLHACSIV